MNEEKVGRPIYKVIYKDPRCETFYDRGKLSMKYYEFMGYLENFNPQGLSAFINEEREMVLINYNDILQMRRS